MIGFSKHNSSMSDEEIIARALELGMVMQEEQDEDTQSESMNLETPTENQEDTDSSQDTDTEGTSLQDTENTSENAISDITDAQEEAVSGITDAQEDASNQLSRESYQLTIKSGEVCRNVCEHLAEAGVIDDSETFRKYLSEIGYASNMRVGEYEIPYGLSMEEVAAILQAGPKQ
jgi:hypothetical protein